MKLMLTWLFAAFTCFYTANAQNADLEKRVEKAEKKLKEGKAEEAEKMLVELAQKYPGYGLVWNKLSEAQLYVYADKMEKDKSVKGMTITTKDEKGNVIENDTLANRLMELLKGIKPSDTYKRQMLYTWRLACTQTLYAYKPAMLIRIYEIDQKKKKDVKDAAWVQFLKAEEEFQKQNYTSASKYYQKAIDLDPTFYKARLYLGDVYYATKRYDLALQQFQEAIKSNPDELEPRKYYFDALMNSQSYEKAYEAGKDAMMIYPDFTQMIKLQDVATDAGRKCNFGWIKRDVLPNSLATAYTPDKDDIVLPMPENSPWKHYKDALADVKAYSDKKGILTENSVTKQKYLEIYSWEKMLEKSDAPDLAMARKMQKLGMLDCYVFISCFHFDFYDQYLDFVKNNKQRINDYFEVLNTLN